MPGKDREFVRSQERRRQYYSAAPSTLPIYHLARVELPDEMLLDYLMEFLETHRPLITSKVLPWISCLQERVNLAILLEICRERLKQVRSIHWDYRVSGKDVEHPQRPDFIPVGLVPGLAGKTRLSDDTLFSLVASLFYDHAILFLSKLDRYLRIPDKVYLAECLVIAERRSWIDGKLTCYDLHEGTSEDPTPFMEYAWQKMSQYLAVDQASLPSRTSKQAEIRRAA